MNIFFTSDTHYNHRNIVKGLSRWSNTDKCRNFNSLQEHNDCLVNNFNSVLGPDDVLYHLGDWSFGGSRYVREFRERLNCRTVHLIYGNHDTTIEKTPELQDLFTSVQHYKKIDAGDGIGVVLSHYAMRVWHHQGRGVWMLHGHSHGVLPPYGDAKTMDVGVDTNNLFPYSIQDLKTIFKSNNYK